MRQLDLYVRELRQLFNAIDPAPFRERDLDPAAEAFVVDWAMEQPTRAPLRLVVHVEQQPDPTEKAVVEEAVPQFFVGRAAASRLQLRRLFRRGRISLAIALVCLAIAVSVASLLDRPGVTHPLVIVLRESLIVGGWVAMWRPMEIFLYAWWPMVAEARRFDRLAAMPVEIRTFEVRRET